MNAMTADTGEDKSKAVLATLRRHQGGRQAPFRLPELLAELHAAGLRHHFAWHCDATQPWVMRAELSIEGAGRCGIGIGPTPDEAKAAALTDLAVLWLPAISKEEAARLHISEAVDRINALGLGAQAAPILMRGYGKSIEESREIYNALRKVLQENGHA